ncbi:TonB-dependent receptor plug domain-containing protein [Mucilaginibacter gynuensis]|uniref:TonB-dependent receptor plug domain-containing protein n=1 Tax=Mucilaginibacter gynuensis TaxID=1302236 RepID=A0ABP8GW09_9SPHI
MSYRKILALLCTVLCAVITISFSVADDDPIQKIAAQLEKWLSNNPPEKVYLHLDKPYYASGDTIWFKSYVTIGSTHQLSGLSGILNVDLINDKDVVEQSVKLPLISGLAWGDFALADTIKEGSYRVRAYTNYMRNAGEDYFFDRTINVVNAISNKVFTKTDYTYTSVNGIQKVNAIINYSNIEGVPYAAKEVSYQVEYDGKRVDRGKGVTDDKGNLSLSFDNKLPFLSGQGKIVTQVSIDKKEKISKTVIVKAASAKVDVQFFPEGGNLVNSLASVVAFKATGADGLGKDIKGVIKDEQNAVVANFASAHLGMGQFNLTPQAGHTYKAYVTYADGSEATVDLPKALAQGYVINIDTHDANRLIVRVENNLPGDPGVISLVGQSDGKLYYAAKGRSGEKSFVTTIPKSRFPSGTIQFTLFSATGEPLNERLVFIQNKYSLRLDVTADKQVYKTREHVKLNLSSKDEEDKPLQGIFSVAVIDETSVPMEEESEHTIFSDILLTSNIKGYVEKPNYYFTNENDKTRADLDVLMLTQGFRRFEWKQVLAGNTPPGGYQPEKTLELSGTATFKGKPVVKGPVTIFNTAGNLFTRDTVTDANGHFKFTNLLFKDSAKLVVQVRTADGKTGVKIELDNTKLQAVTKNKNAPDVNINLNEGMNGFLHNNKSWYDWQVKNGIGNRTILLKEVNIRQKKESPVKNSSNLNGSGNADQILTAKDLSLGCTQLDICLQGRLTGVIFKQGLPYSTRGPNSPMSIIIDGSPVEGDALSSISVPDVETIEVLRTVATTAIYGSRGAGGVIIITTKRGDGGRYDPSRWDAPGLIPYSPKGYYLAREFYSPKYDEESLSRNQQLLDLRTTIYWNPNIITDENGNAVFDFYNADGKGTYKVIVEGIDNDGVIGRKVFRYKVQ